MAASTIALELRPQLEDALSYLPIGNNAYYKKGQTIYGPNHPSNSIYLVVSGKVEISHIAEGGKDVLLEIIRPDELFGESAFLDPSRRSDQARTLETVALMSWPVSDIEDLVAIRPRLALALLQIFAQRNLDFTGRIESFSFDTIERRLARSLIRFSERLGSPDENGSVRMMPFTHEMLSRYVGTSREIVTQYMSKFRKQGHLSYSRRETVVYRHSLQTVLDAKLN